MLWTIPCFLYHIFHKFVWNQCIIYFYEITHEKDQNRCLQWFQWFISYFWGEITSNKVIDSLPLLKDYATRSKKFAFFAWSLKFHFQLLLWLAAFWNCFWVFYFRMLCNIKTMKSCSERIVIKSQFDIS